MVAFLAEAAIAFLLLFVVLVVNASPHLARYTGLVVGLLVATYILVEAPLSGMSMNPARTFASAVIGGDWSGAWLYFVAPPLGMLAAAEAYLRWRGGRRVACAKLRHDPGYRCIFCEAQRGKGPS